MGGSASGCTSARASVRVDVRLNEGAQEWTYERARGCARVAARVGTRRYGIPHKQKYARFYCLFCRYIFFAVRAAVRPWFDRIGLLLSPRNLQYFSRIVFRKRVLFPKNLDVSVEIVSVHMDSRKSTRTEIRPIVEKAGLILLKLCPQRRWHAALTPKGPRTSKLWTKGCLTSLLDPI